MNKLEVKNIREHIIDDKTKQIVISLMQDGKEIELVLEGSGKLRILAPNF